MRLNPTVFSVAQTSLLVFALLAGAHPALSQACLLTSGLAVPLLAGAAWWSAEPGSTRVERALDLAGIVAGLGLMLMMAAEVTGPRVLADTTALQVLLLLWGAFTARTAFLRLPTGSWYGPAG